MLQYKRRGVKKIELTNDEKQKLLEGMPCSTNSTEAAYLHMHGLLARWQEKHILDLIPNTFTHNTKPSDNDSVSSLNGSDSLPSASNPTTLNTDAPLLRRSFIDERWRSFVDER